MAGFTLILHGLATRHIYHYFNSSLRLLNCRYGQIINIFVKYQQPEAA